MFRRTPPDHEPETSLLARADAWLRAEPAFVPGGDTVREIAGQQGIDFATCVVHQWVRGHPSHGAFARALEALPATVAPGCRLDATLAIVPGAFYREHPQTGSDGRMLREAATAFGCRCELIPLPSFGRLRPAAGAIVEWLARRPEGERIVLVSLSKGGGEVKLALAEPGAAAAFRNVAAWVNLCGLLQGTPLANWVLSRRLRRWWFRLLLGVQGYDFDAVRELVRAHGALLDGELRLPPHLRLISVVAFPLQRHLTTPLARRCHRRVSPHGPNDGAGVLLSDVGAMQGLVYPLWGADHYLKPTGHDARDLAVRILHYLQRAWEGEAPAEPWPLRWLARQEPRPPDQDHALSQRGGGP